MYEVENIAQKKSYKLAIAYDALLTIGVPLNILFIIMDTTIWKHISHKLILILYGLLAFIYWGIVIALGIINIVQSFKKYTQEDYLYCINALLILKYGLVIFFIVNFSVIVLAFLAAGIISLMGSRGAIIFALPVLAPWIVLILALCVVVTWLLMLPGSFYGIQVIRFGLKQGRITAQAAILHGILQFVFLLDVLDAFYLSVKIWHRGKKSSLAIATVYIAAILGAVAFILYLR